MMKLKLLFGAATLLAASVAAGEEYSPYTGPDVPMQVFWGDTHLHSSYSMDANVLGNTRLSPAEAYEFAGGGTLTANNGMQVRLDTPLDFLVVSDHAEYMGLLPSLRSGDPRLLADPAAASLAQELAGGTERAQKAMQSLIASLAGERPMIDNSGFKQGIWDDITRTADQYYRPGVFTTLIGYEWTSMPGGDNLHRVVVYRDGAEKAGRMVPVSAFDGDRPGDLWAFMAEYERRTGGAILAIPHNANLSNGRMFAVEDVTGKPMDLAEARARARWEPLVEVTQIKGDGETHPLLSPDDEFADFETWDKGNLNVVGTTPKQPGMLRYEYARSALKLGLELDARLGVNPFRFGLIGSTDAHTSLATAAENNFWGKATLVEPGAERMQGVLLKSADSPRGDIMAWQQVASGYVGVWATANTREALFDAMQRKEVYATTGPRITVRFFGGWDIAPGDVTHPDNARTGYRKGVPMGGELPSPPRSGMAPAFMVTAIKDPSGANLDRVQIIKGWRSVDGGLHEQVYNVALSGGRDLARPEPLVSTVRGAEYDNSIGAAQLTAWWQDPDFDPAERAFYYARVLEIPVPRWTAYDAARLGKTVPPETPASVQDRAYTSPIWFTPEG